MAEAFDAIILGAGAAGLMCAAAAGARGRRVLLLDHAPEAGRKILISGGGRCNFTNRAVGPENFLSSNPHFAKSALARYTPADFLALMARHRIDWHEKTLGQLFCDGSARQVVAMLLAECEAGGVDLRLSTRVTEVTRADRFHVSTDRGDFAAPALVLATGRLSIPKLGATGLTHDLARRFGLPLVAPRPALVPLTFAAETLALMQPLAGVALPAVTAHGAAAFREAILLTHRGLSGPAILQISSYWRPGEAVTLDLVPDRDAAALLLAAKRARPRIAPATALGDLLPARLAAAFATAHLPAARLADLPDRSLAALGALLNRWSLTPSGTEGYAKAEVTAGGIDTAALNSRTMEARAVPGLFAIGEGVDVTGWLGGYNFQWAWASGVAAAEAL